MAVIKYFLFSIFFLSVLVIAYSQTNILDQLVPVGIESDHVYYLARGLVGGHWLTGKSVFVIQGHRAYFPYEYEHETGDFQTLVGPQIALSWVATRLWYLPANWIVGGTDPATGETSFICRAWHGAHLINGRGIQSAEICYVGIFNQVFTYTDYEVLVLNAYGIVTRAASVPDQPGPVFLPNHFAKMSDVFEPKSKIGDQQFFSGYKY